MNSIPKSLPVAFERAGSQIGMLDPVIVCKFFRRGSREFWYAIEYDEIDRLFYGIHAKGSCWVWSYFCLDEIQNSVDVAFDSSFQPRNLTELLRSVPIAVPFPSSN